MGTRYGYQIRNISTTKEQRVYSAICRSYGERRYQTAVTNSYFEILIKYGDEFVTLGFQDLIEVKSGSSVEDVHLIDVAFQKYVYTGAGLKIRRAI